MGIGDLIEDDVKKMHQTEGNFEARSSRLKSRAVAQSKMEVMSHNNLVQQHMHCSQQLGKRKLDVITSSIKIEKIKVLKAECDQKRLEVLHEIEKNPIPKLITAYDKLKHETKNQKN
jgi:hypothetical protein